MGNMSEMVDQFSGCASFGIFDEKVQFPTTFATLTVSSLLLFTVYRLVNLRGKGPGGVRDGRVRRYPPGPRGLPLLGSLLDFRTDVYTKMKQYVETFGDIYRVKVRYSGYLLTKLHWHLTLYPIVSISYLVTYTGIIQVK